MTTYDELVSAIRERPLNERLSLLQVLAESIKDEVTPISPRRGTPAEKLLGIARPDGPMPSDEELDEMRFNDLLKKYS